MRISPFAIDYTLYMNLLEIVRGDSFGAHGESSKVCISTFLHNGTWVLGHGGASRYGIRIDYVPTLKGIPSSTCSAGSVRAKADRYKRRV